MIFNHKDRHNASACIELGKHQVEGTNVSSTQGVGDVKTHTHYVKSDPMGMLE